MASDREPRKLFEAPPEVTFWMTKMFFSTLADPELQFRGGHMASAEREPITGVWGQSPSGVQGQSPWSGVRETKPPP